MKVMADCCTLCQILRSYHDANHACPKRKHENSGPEFPGFSFNMVFPQKKVPELAQQATTWDWAFLTFKTTRLEKTVFYCFAHFCGTNQGEDPNWVGSHLGPIWILYATQKKKRVSLQLSPPSLGQHRVAIAWKNVVWRSQTGAAFHRLTWYVDVHM